MLHIFRQVLFWARNQGNHQNFDPSLLSYKCWLIFIGMKQKKIQKKFKKNSKWPSQKNWDFQLSQFSIFFHENFRVSRIIWCEGHQCCSTYISHIGWATLMSFASIYLTTQGPIPEIFAKKYWELGELKISVFWVGHFNFFLLHPNENQSTFIG